MSIIDSSLAGLTLDDVLGNAKRSEPAPSQNDTISDSIRDDDTSPKKSWKLFRDKLRLRRTGSAWTSSIPIPTSDVNIQGNMTHNSRRNHIDNGGEHAPDGKTHSLLARKSSLRYDHHDPVDATMPGDAPPSSSFHPQKARSHSTGDDNDDHNSLTTWRALSAREAVASQEAAEAAAAAEKASTKNMASSEVDEPVTMSLMDLLGESGYTMGEDDDVYYNEDDEEEEESMQEDGTEFTCCICKVNFTSSTFMPCGHEFCRLCSKELSVERGNCSLCDGFVLEILEIF